MNHYMLDIETLGNGTNGAIVAIGVCAFDPAQGKLENDQDWSRDFYRTIDLTKSAFPGVIDASNVEWWLQQSPEAQRELYNEGRIPLENALVQLNTWLVERGIRLGQENDAVRLWSKPPLFDERLMREAYTRHRYTFPWHWRASRDIRTLIDDARELGIVMPDDATRTTVKHNALEDARHQARIVCAIRQEMRCRQRTRVIE